MTREAVTCSRCGIINIYPLPTRVSAEETPELLKKVYDLTLFDWVCPACGHRMELDFKVHFTNKGHTLTMVYTPEKDATIDGLLGDDGNPLRMDDFLRDLAHQRHEEGYKNAACRIVHHRLHFFEKALVFKHKLNDKVIEVMKLAATDRYKKDFPGKEAVLSIFVFKKTGYEIVVFDPEGNASSIPVKKRDYRRTARLFRKTYGNIDPYEVCIDSKWVANLLFSHRKEEQ